LNLKYDGNQLINAKDWFNDEDDAEEGDAFVDYSLPQFVDKNNDGVEYTYDANGNMTSDYNKGITEIKYNSLNLPQAIQFKNGNAIYYTYDAMGEKLKTEYYTIKSAVQIPMGSIMPYTQLKALSYETTRAYCGSLIYENDVPSTWQVDNGYVSLDDSKYHFYFTDHEGNTRAVVNQDGTVEQVNNYCPYGLSYAKDTKTTANRFKYNDKELETMHSLDWYDYGARFYDPELCQWHTVDPLAENYYSISPYAYCGGNPVNAVDPDGKDVAILIAKDGANGYGHMAAVIQNKNGKYYYMTVGNAEEGASLLKMFTSGTHGGMNLKHLGAKNMKEAINLAKQDGSNSTYTDQVVLKTNSKMDNAIYNAATSEQDKINTGKEKYNVLTNNCADVVVKVIENGIKVDLKDGSSPKPNTKFDNIKVKVKETQQEINKKESIY
jgi:RHS repeat-associated protein